MGYVSPASLLPFPPLMFYSTAHSQLLTPSPLWKLLIISEKGANSFPFTSLRLYDLSDNSHLCSLQLTSPLPSRLHIVTSSNLSRAHHTTSGKSSWPAEVPTAALYFWYLESDSLLDDVWRRDRCRLLKQAKKQKSILKLRHSLFWTRCLLRILEKRGTFTHNGSFRRHQHKATKLWCWTHKLRWTHRGTMKCLWSFGRRV